MSHPSSGSGRRTGTAALAVTLAFAGLTLGAAPAQADPDPRPLTQGADWLSGELTNGLLRNTQYDYDDYGLSIDAALAFDAIGGHASQVTSIADAIAAHVDSYVTGEDFGDTGSSYAGATAKAAVLAQIAGDDATSFGGEDLVSRLGARVATTAPVTGRIEDQSTYDDYANTLGQAFAARALHEAGSADAGSVLDFLLDQQCSAGYFRLYFTADKNASDQTCNGGRATGDSAADTDATAVTLMMLEAMDIDTAQIGRAMGKAESWLLAQQHADGSFGGGPSTEAVNANSTGLAGWALGDQGDTVAASRAAVWVRQHQADSLPSCHTELDTETGAIALDDAALRLGDTAGLTQNSRDQWRRATAQALPVLRWSPGATPALTLSGPSGYVRAGTSAKYRVSGLVPGDQVCLSLGTTNEPATAGIEGNVSLLLRLPAGTVNRTITAMDRAGNVETVQTKVLGAKRLTVRVSQNRVHRRHRIRVVVSGLAPGERVVLRFRGRTVRRGVAWSNGRFVRAIRVSKKLGRTRIVAWGQFPDIRNGSRVIRVIR